MITLPCASLPAKSRVGARHGVASAVNSITQGGDHPVDGNRMVSAIYFISIDFPVDFSIGFREATENHFFNRRCDIA